MGHMPIWGDCSQAVGKARAKALRQSVPGVFKGTARRLLGCGRVREAEVGGQDGSWG